MKARRSYSCSTCAMLCFRRITRRLAEGEPADERDAVDMLLPSNVKPEKLDDARVVGERGDVEQVDGVEDVGVMAVDEEGPKAVLRRRRELRGCREWKREFVIVVCRGTRRYSKLFRPVSVSMVSLTMSIGRWSECSASFTNLFRS